MSAEEIQNNEKLMFQTVLQTDSEKHLKATQYVSPDKVGNLKEEHLIMLKTLRKEVTKEVTELHKVPADYVQKIEKTSFFNDWALYRFLYGWGWKYKEAKKYIMESIAWHYKERPDLWRMKDIKNVAKDGFIYSTGYDRLNRPLLFLILENDKIENNKQTGEQKFRLLVNSVEDAVRKMSKNVYQLTWVVDLKNSSFGLALVKKMKYLFDNLGQHYPERAGRILVLNPPWTLSLIFAFIRPFLTEDQVSKYIFIKGNEASIKKQLLKYIPEDQLPDYFYKGTKKFKFDIDQIIKDDEARLNKIQKKEEEVDEA